MLIEQLIWLLVCDVVVDDAVADFKILQVDLQQVFNSNPKHRGDVYHSGPIAGSTDFGRGSYAGCHIEDST